MRNVDTCWRSSWLEVLRLPGELPPPAFKRNRLASNLAFTESTKHPTLEMFRIFAVSANCLKHFIYGGEVQRGFTQEDTAMVNQEMLP